MFFFECNVHVQVTLRHKINPLIVMSNYYNPKTQTPSIITYCGQIIKIKYT